MRFPALRGDFLAWVQARGAVVRDSTVIPPGCRLTCIAGSFLIGSVPVTLVPSSSCL